MKSIEPKDISMLELQGYLQGAIAPRPIAFASTISTTGKPNLSPFSFFNIFGFNPPILVFSPVRKSNDNAEKHTLINCKATREVVINVVNYDMVEQMSMTSADFPEGINEFLKSGLTQIPSDIVKPYRVAESPVQLECKVTEIIALGNSGGAGNLIICEVVKIHINEKVLDAKGAIDPSKIDLVARLNGNWYTRANKGLFEVEKSFKSVGIGVDAFPDFVIQSTVFNGNDFGKLATINCLPTNEEIDIFVKQNFVVKGILSSDDAQKIHSKAKEYLNNNDVVSAWKLLLAKEI